MIMRLVFMSSSEWQGTLSVSGKSHGWMFYCTAVGISVTKDSLLGKRKYRMT